MEKTSPTSNSSQQSSDLSSKQRASDKELATRWNNFHQAMQMLSEAVQSRGGRFRASGRASYPKGQAPNGLQYRSLSVDTQKSIWVDGGYQNNGYCSFMRGNFSGPCCGLPHGHNGDHQVIP